MGRSSAALVQTTKTTDGFSNPPARLGNFTPNLIESTQYPMTRLSNNFQLMNSLYRSHWVVRRIIDVIPQDMCKNWYKITSQISPEDLQRFKKVILRTQIHRKILEGLKWGRLYGGAAGLIMIEGHEDFLDEPLKLDEVMPSSFKGLMIFDRWSGMNPMSELVTDISDPDFGLPKFYQITSQGSAKTGTLIHHSRMIRFTGRDLPLWEKQMESFWGASEIEHVYDELKKRDNTSWNIAQLTFNANVKTLKFDGMEEILGVAPAKAQQDLYAQIEAITHVLSNMGLLVLGAKDEFQNYQYAFGGLSEVYECFMMDVAGAAEIPVTRLFGRSPAGMNATGESDLQNYYDTVEERQEADLRPILDRVLPIMFVSEFGAIPDDFDYEFNPCRRLSDKERSSLAKEGTEAIMVPWREGLVSDQTALRELKQLSEQTGLWSNITDSDIEQANDTSDPGESDLGEDLLKMSLIVRLMRIGRKAIIRETRRANFQLVELQALILKRQYQEKNLHRFWVPNIKI